MDRRVTTRYDATGDILYVDLVPQYPQQVSDMLSDYVVARSNPKTGEIENLELLFFVRTLTQEGKFDLPLLARLLPDPSHAAMKEAPPAPGRRAS